MDKKEFLTELNNIAIDAVLEACPGCGENKKEWDEDWATDELTSEPCDVTNYIANTFQDNLQKKGEELWEKINRSTKTF